jgi:hypothetical protein
VRLYTASVAARALRGVTTEIMTVGERRESRTPGAAIGSAGFFLLAPGVVAGVIPWSLTRWRVAAPLPASTAVRVRRGGADPRRRSRVAGRRTILAATPALGGHKPWSSPDARKILFMCATPSSGDHNEDICVMNADGTRIADLTNTPTTLENWPSWGPLQSP